MLARGARRQERVARLEADRKAAPGRVGARRRLPFTRVGVVGAQIHADPDAGGGVDIPTHQPERAVVRPAEAGAIRLAGVPDLKWQVVDRAADAGVPPWPHARLRQTLLTFRAILRLDVALGRGGLAARRAA